RRRRRKWGGDKTVRAVSRAADDVFGGHGGLRAEEPIPDALAQGDDELLVAVLVPLAPHPAPARGVDHRDDAVVWALANQVPLGERDLLTPLVLEDIVRQVHGHALAV